MKQEITHLAYSTYTKEAMKLFSDLICAERKAQKMTQQELADRTGVSRSLIKRLEKGDLSCSIGAVFEAAHVLGIKLFDMGPERLQQEIFRVEEKLALLPTTIHKKPVVVDDDF